MSLSPPLRASLAAALLGACSVSAPSAAPDTLSLPSLPDRAVADEPVFAPADLRADLDALYAGLSRAHYDLFANRSPNDYDTLHAKMRAATDAPLRVSEAKLWFQKFAAYGDVAHARVDFPFEVWGAYRDEGGTGFPFYPLVREGDLFVGLDGTDGTALSPGDRIVSIDGIPGPQLVERLGTLVSADNAYILGTLLEGMFPALMWATIGEHEAFELVVEPADGRPRRAVVDATTADERKASTSDGPPPPPAIRAAEMMSDGIAYLRPGPFYNVEDEASPWDPTDFLAFLDDAYGMFAAEGATALLIDLRNNPGGDNSFSDPMIARFADRPFRFASRFEIRSSPEAKASNAARIEGLPAASAGISGVMAERYGETPYGETFELELPMASPHETQRFDGPVYVLIDRYSYSNAVNAAALIQDYGFGTIVGEETSDLATTYGAMETFTLPRTGITVGFPKALIVRPSGSLETRGVVPDCQIDNGIVETGETVLASALDIVRDGGC